ncbi:MAG: alpha/beta hydrolase [Rubrivivax sp.]|nr:alpha/beta hydrolase [Rubrivivax sp.]
MSGMVIHTQFVQVGERRVLVRAAGRGPALVLLHQSPESSLSMLPWFERLAGRFAVFAPDTPGFGFSDPLPLTQPGIPDLAAALGALLRSLGIERALLFGVHTGAAIATRLARDEPAAVAGLVCDGLSAFRPDERQPLLDGYLPPFEPSWDGAHLLWLWARIREQTLFFPWHVSTAAARLRYPLATPAQIHKSVMELLDAGDGYRAGYRAPLLYEHGAASAAELQVPAQLLYRRQDVLRPHLDRLPPLPAQVSAREVPDAAALTAAALAAFEAQAAGASTVDAAAALSRALSPTRRIVATPHGLLAFHRAPGDGACAELSLGDIGTPAALPADRSPGALALALDLPGHGASSGWAAESLMSDEWLDALIDALPGLGVSAGLRLRGRGGGAALALALARRLGPRCERLWLHDPLLLAPDERARFLAGLPPLALQASGAHLIEVWNWVRMKSLFWPWLLPDGDAAIDAAAPPPRRVHGEAVELLRAGPCVAALWQRALDQEACSPAGLNLAACRLSAAPQAEMQGLLQRLQALWAGAGDPART